MADALVVTYLVRSDPGAIEERAEALLLEQTVELPRSALHDAAVAASTVGRVIAIDAVSEREHRVAIEQPVETTADEPAQFLNVLFGNSSLQPDVLLEDVDVPCDWTRAQTWEFHPLDDDAFPAVRLARQVGAAGGTYPAVYNAANEVCVEAFRAGRLAFPEIVDTIAAVLAAHDVPSGEQPGTALTVDDVLAADAWARATATARIEGTA